MNKLIITAALVGPLSTEEQNSKVPITPDELARDTLACYNAGSAVTNTRKR